MLSDQIRIVKVKYYTSHMLSKGDGNKDATNQKVYLSAIRSQPQVEVVLGHMYAKTVWRPIANLPIAGLPIRLPKPVVIPEGEFTVAHRGVDRVLRVGRFESAKARTKNRREAASLRFPVYAAVVTTEEKGTDVNLAVHMLNDAWLELYDVAFVFSNDSDLAEAVRLVAEERGKLVVVVCPLRSTVAGKLEQVASAVLRTTTAMYKESQFPDSIPGTALTKPRGLRWASTD